MTLTAYSPFDSQIDRLFADAVRTFGQRVSPWIPACNAWEEDEKFSLELALPGWRNEEVSLSVEKGVLTVQGNRETREPSAEEAKRTYHIREREQGAFTRSFRLPGNVEWEKAHASFKDGVLTIEFPKRDEAKPRRIMIQ